MVFSSNEKARVNSHSFLSSKGFEKFQDIWKEVWSKIRYSTAPDISDYIELVMDTCDSFYLDPNSITELPDIFRSIDANINEFNMLSGDKYDIIYQMLRLSGYVSKFDMSNELSSAIADWLPSSDRMKSLPNDVKLGFIAGQNVGSKYLTPKQ